jgi:hypothetical protein
MRFARTGMILLALPEFCVDEAEEAFVAGDASEAGAGEGGLRVGQVVGSEARKDAEGEIEGADVKGGEGFEERGAGWAEVGQDPEGAGADGGEAEGEAIDFGLVEAVEEEVGDDEVGG